MLNIVLSGQKYFGAEVFRAIKQLPDVKIIAVSAPYNRDKPDRLWAQADLYNVPIIRSGTLNSDNVPENTNLIISAHSHDFIGEKTRLRATYGGIGYHPSALPIHRGRDAIRWTIKFRDRITGGTVYKLSNRMDGGDVIAQEFVFIRPDDDAETLWRRELAPLGVRLLTETVSRIAKEGHIHGKKQDEKCATFEPSWERQPAYRPDLLMISLHKNA